MANEQEQMQEQKQPLPTQAVVDSDGNTFALQEYDLPERPRSLLEEIEKAQRAQDPYHDIWVWHCCVGPNCCNGYFPPNTPHHSTNPHDRFSSKKVKLSAVPHHHRERLLMDYTIEQLRQQSKTNKNRTL